MLDEKPSGLVVDTDAQFPLVVETDYIFNCPVVTVTGLPSGGSVLMAGRRARVTLGESLTAADIAALSFSSSPAAAGEPVPWRGLVIYVPQTCGRLPIPLFDSQANLAPDAPLVIKDLPANGSVHLADGVTGVIQGQVITAAQLCGLTFAPAADAVGQISLLRYVSADQRVVGGALLVVGPDTVAGGAVRGDAAASNTSIAPIAAALLLEAGLSSLASATASAAIDPNDVLPGGSSAEGAPAGIPRSIPDRLVSPVSNQTVVGDIAILAQSSPPEANTVDSTETNSPTTDTLPRHRVGSSTPPDFYSQTRSPLLRTADPGATVPRIFAANSALQVTSVSSTASLSQDLFVSSMPLLARTAPTSVSTTSTTTHWTNSTGGNWNAVANWSAGVPDWTRDAAIDAAGNYVVTSNANVSIRSLSLNSGVTLSVRPGSLFDVEGDVVNNGIFDTGRLSKGPGAQVDIAGNVSGSGSFRIADNAILEVSGTVSGQLVNGSFSGITIFFDGEHGRLTLDHSALFHGLIGSSSQDVPLSKDDLIDLKDLPFTSSISASVHYDGVANISTVDFSNGSTTVTLNFAGKELNWTFARDGNGGTVVSDPVTSNPISLENQKPGTPQSVWQIDPGQDSTKIQGFTTAISTNVGGTIQFKINNQTGTPNYHIDIYRLGYYGGNGARLVTTLQHQAATSVVQPAPLKDASTGLVDAGNWSVTDSWSVPTDAVSGVYIANVIDGTQIFQIPFVVRNDASHSAIVFQTSDQTWEAYNPWGGANLYAGNGPGVNGSAYAVSYNRPITTRDGGLSGTSNDMVFSAEYPAIYWLEENGYDVSYISGLDAATNGSLLLNHQVYMDVGHDEYWTDGQVANVQAAGHAGVNLMFLSGNEVYWQTRFAASIDPSHTANRTLISYKDTHANRVIDPTGTATGTFMDARFASSGGMSGIPSNALTGTVFQVDSDRTDVMKIPYGMTKLRFWRNTSVANTAPGQTASLAQNLLGYEWDSSPDNGFRPRGLINLSSTTLQVNTYLLDYGNTVGNGTATHNLVEFRDPVSGALVFGAGTVFWTWGLASDHDQVVGSPTPIDPNVQQATVNLFADMGVQPATLQASLVIASQSTDHTAPSSTITNLSATSVVEGQPVTVTGTASDVGGVIGGVEVSSDSGKTWHPASSTVGASNVTWSYTFSAGASGPFKVQSRAVDDSLNQEVPGAGVAYTVTPSSNLTIFSPTDTPSVANTADASAVELGVKFVASVSGDITGIRFYKGSQNTGTHLGDLWTTNGTLLASATFTNETASGWQQVNFATPVHIQAGVTYIASYHTNTGHYSTTDFYFDNAGHTHGALTATGSGLNGVYAYGAGASFPNNVSIINGDNYWVDVVFKDTSLQPQANNDSGFTVTENGSLTIAASTLLANDTDPSGLPFSITSVSSPVNGAVSYDAQAQTVTFTPNTGYAGAAQFTYTITDSGGASGSGQVALNVNYPLYAQSLFGTNDTPSVPNSGDASSVEIGVKFTASASGTITGLRFYKGSSNTGTHVAHLWTSTGTLLASAAFTGETASGWQQVNFSTPVTLTAGTTYVASYHTNGNYSASQNYFTTSLTNGQLTAPAAGNGLYSYGSGAVFPTNTYKSTNYWVDVVFDSTSRPIANPDSGFVVSENGSITIAASTLLANDSNSGGLAISLKSVSSPVNGTVSYNSSANTITFVPTAGYSGTASFTYTIGDTSGATASAGVSLFVNDPTAESLFSLSATPSTVTTNDNNSVELGVKFTASSSGVITGLRFYKGPQNTGTHVADLWSSNGTLLASATFSNETGSGWQQVNFASPVAIAAGTTYVASYHTSGNYSTTANYFTNSVVSGDLTAPAAGNGVYAYGSTSIFPTSNFNASNYWVDVVYSKSSQPPVANNDSGFVVSENGSTTIAASALLANDTDPNGLPLSITGVSNPSSGTASYDPNTKSVTFVPNAGYTGTASFIYSVTDTAGQTASASASLLVTDPSSSSLFNPTTAPSIVTVNDPTPVELGVKFQSSSNGFITGLRFYKGPQNIGTHVADLWSSTGTLLASATFTSETASGWQQVNFATPVAISAGTNYVASYHTNGEYSADSNLFATALTNGPLTAPSSQSSGGNGVYAYGTGSLFPTNSFNATSYGVDVIFRPQLAA